MKQSNRGRKPFKVTNDVLETVRKLAAQGCYERDIAACIGVSPSYLPELKRKHPNIAEAIEIGTSFGIAKVTGKLMEAIEERNMTAIIWYLKAKAGWRESGNSEPSIHASVETATSRILASIRNFKEKQRNSSC